MSDLPRLTRDMRERLSGETLYRNFTLRADPGSEKRIAASFSSDTPIARWFGSEVLSHEAGAVNLDRVMDGKLPLLFGHDTDTLIGFADQIAATGSRLEGFINFSDHGRGPEVLAQIREGMPLGISIGYRIDEWLEKAGSDEITATRWTLHEISVVTVPADTSVGINRSLAMSDPIIPSVDAPDVAVSAAANIANVRTRAVADGVKTERLRTSAIRELFILPGFQADEFLELERLALDGGLSVEDTRTELLKLAGSGTSALISAGPQTNIYVTGPSERANARPAGRSPLVSAGADSLDKMRDAMVGALAIRSNPKMEASAVKAARTGNEFLGMTLVEMARECLKLNNVSCNGADKMRIVGMAFTDGFSLSRAGTFTIGHGTSDFANILLDAANKAMMTGWVEAEETFPIWTRAMNLADFKAQNLINLALFGDLDVIPEHAEYKYGTFSDVKESITLRTYGKLFSISRQAIVNDDMSAFTLIPQRMGRAAARMVGDEAYAVLTGNPTLNQDSLAVFHATHGNLVTTGGAVISTATLDAGFTAMATRTDPSGGSLNVVPSFAIVPRALENTARVLVASQYDPNSTAGVFKPNGFQGRLQVVADARLDAFNAQGWFLAASPSNVGTVVVGYLDGRQEPYMEQQEAFSQDGIAMKVRIDCRAVPEDFRGMYYNDGA